MCSESVWATCRPTRRATKTARYIWLKSTSSAAKKKQAVFSCRQFVDNRPKPFLALRAEIDEAAWSVSETPLGYFFVVPSRPGVARLRRTTPGYFTTSTSGYQAEGA